jgi:hypothetical protein
VTSINLLFVASEYFAAFGIPDNSLALMRDDSDIPRIFVGYDGHVFLAQGERSGFISLPWHGLKLKVGTLIFRANSAALISSSCSSSAKCSPGCSALIAIACLLELGVYSDPNA